MRGDTVTVGRVAGRRVLGVPNLRHALVGWGLSVISENAALVALLVVAYDVGGPTLVAVFVAIRAVPALVVGPVLIGRSDRGHRERWLVGVLATRTALLALTAACLVVDARDAALVLGGMATVLFTTHRPMNAALMPYLAHTPAQLTAANGVSAFFEGAGTLIGPALAGVLLVVGEPSVVLLAATVLLGAATLTVALVRDVPASGSPAEPLTFRSAARDLGSGLDVLRRPSVVLVLVSAQTFARGVLLVCVVVLGVDVFGQGEPGVGWLSSMLGLGGLVGSVVAVVLLTSTRLARGFSTGVALWGLPMLLLGLWTTPAVGFAAFAVIGFGNAFVDVGVFTLVARLVPPAMMGRAFAALEVVIVLSVTAGSWAAGLAIEQIGVEALLVAVGALLIALTLAYSRQAARLDRQLEPAEHAETLRACDVLSTLPVVSIDYLASTGQENSYADSEVVMRQGEPGLDFHVVISGSARALINGTSVGQLGPGEGFGEIALLRDVPRTASVVADGDLRTLSVHREDFLVFVVGHPASVTALSDVASSRERENARRLADS